MKQNVPITVLLPVEVAVSPVSVLLLIQIKGYRTRPIFIITSFHVVSWPNCIRKTENNNITGMSQQSSLKFKASYSHSWIKIKKLLNLKCLQTQTLSITWPNHFERVIFLSLDMRQTLSRNISNQKLFKVRLRLPYSCKIGSSKKCCYWV